MFDSKATSILTSMITDKMRNAKNKTSTKLEAELVCEFISSRPVRPNTDQTRRTEVLNKLKMRKKLDLISYSICYSPVPEFSFLPAPYWNGKKGVFRVWTISAKTLPSRNLIIKGTFNKDNSEWRFKLKVNRANITMEEDGAYFRSNISNNSI